MTKIPQMVHRTQTLCSVKWCIFLLLFFIEFGGYVKGIFSIFSRSFGKMFFDRFFPKLLTVKAQEEEEEEELQDPQEILRDQCKEKEHCKGLAEKYQACNDRVNSRKQTTETCVEELFDWLHAIDHCVTKDLFSKLK